MAETPKVYTACAEITRRWRNSASWIPKEKMEEITKDYADDLIGMGYSPEWIEKIVEKALTGYENVLGKVERGETARNRPGKETAQSRRFKRLFANDWYKQKGGKVNQGEQRGYQDAQTKP